MTFSAGLSWGALVVAAGANVVIVRLQRSTRALWRTAEENWRRAAEILATAHAPGDTAADVQPGRPAPARPDGAA